MKTFLDNFSLYMLYLLLLVLYLVFWRCLKLLELCSLSHCSILKKKKRSISLWFSQWWQRRLSYLNGFYHFCSYWYYTSVIEITWQKKKTNWKHVDAKANRNKHWLMYTVESLVFSVSNHNQLLHKNSVKTCVTAASSSISWPYFRIYICFLKWAITYWWNSS